MHWMIPGQAAKRLTAYAEACLLEDEYMIQGGPPPEAMAAIARREPNLTPWCPILQPTGRPAV
jgi:hypothetical protein